MFASSILLISLKHSGLTVGRQGLIELDYLLMMVARLIVLVTESTAKDEVVQKQLVQAQGCTRLAQFDNNSILQNNRSRHRYADFQLALSTRNQGEPGA